MKRPATSRSEWLISLKSNIEPVGECMEWQGQFRGTVPVHYTRPSFAWPGNCRGAHSVRAILWAMSNGQSLPKGHVIRPACWNDKCVDERHFVIMTRAEHVAEQARRGDFATAKFPFRPAVGASSAWRIHLHARPGPGQFQGVAMKTQAERLFHHLRKRWMTTGEMLDLHISTSPWKRLSEGLRHLRDGERLAKRVNGRGLVCYRVVRG